MHYSLTPTDNRPKNTSRPGNYITGALEHPILPIIVHWGYNHAAGDCCSFSSTEALPKAMAIYALQEGPVLARNLE
jgi:hypothetical protein